MKNHLIEKGEKFPYREPICARGLRGVCMAFRSLSQRSSYLHLERDQNDRNKNRNILPPLLLLLSYLMFRKNDKSVFH